MNEEWRLIPGTKGYYSASSHGRIRSEPHKGRSGRVMVLRANRCGYLQFCLSVRGEKPRTVQIQRLVAAAFLGPCPVGMEVNHKDGDKANNAPANLEYCTRSENLKHAYGNDLATRIGDANPNAKLNAYDAVDIRLLGNAGMSKASIAKFYQVTDVTIGHIINRKTWQHV